MKRKCDIVIAGGGMIGASLACALDSLGLDVVVVEASEPPSQGESPAALDERSTALAPATRRILQTLSIWPALAPEAEPIHRIHVSQARGFGVTRLDAAELNVDALGHVVANRALGSALEQQLAACTHVELLRPARVSELAYPGRGVTVTVACADGPVSLHTRLLVAADGAGSYCRRLLGIGADQHDYGHSAIVTNLQLSGSHDGLAYERFTPQGPLALLPMTDGRLGLVWTRRQPEVEHTLGCTDAAFVDALRQQLGGRLGRVAAVGARQAWPLSLVRARQLTAPNGVLIGNAAHTLHPVAGQGFNLGMRDMAVLAEHIAAASQLEAGDWLADYARERHRDHQRLVGFSHGLVQLFGRRSPVPGVLRDAGLLGLDLCTPGKHLFARGAMGLTPTLPRLARGLPLRTEVST